MITLHSRHHSITITDNHIRIGCQQHTINEWQVMGFEEVKAMNGKESAATWMKYKEFILLLAVDR